MMSPKRISPHLRTSTPIRIWGRRPLRTAELTRRSVMSTVDMRVTIKALCIVFDGLGSLTIMSSIQFGPVTWADNARASLVPNEPVTQMWHADAGVDRSKISVEYDPRDPFYSPNGVDPNILAATQNREANSREQELRRHGPKTLSARFPNAPKNYAAQALAEHDAGIGDAMMEGVEPFVSAKREMAARNAQQPNEVMESGVSDIYRDEHDAIVRACVQSAATLQAAQACV